MIDFSNYNEQYPYILPDNITTSFLINPFREKNSKYYHNINHSYPELNGYFDGFNPLSVYEVAIKLDKCLDFFKDFSSYASKVKILSSFENEYSNKINDSWLLVEQLFYKIGSTYKLFGYFDTLINNLINGLITESSFITDLELGINDINTIITPMIDYMYLIELGNSLQGSSWEHLNSNEIIDPNIDSYSRVIISSDIDDRYEAIGISLQVSKNLISTSLKDDRSNIEMIMSKAFKISLNVSDVRQKLMDLVFIIPDY